MNNYFNKMNYNSNTGNTGTSASDAINQNNPKLKNIDPVKLQIITEIKEKSKGKNINQMLPEIMRINQLLNERNMSFTKEETALLFEVIKENMSQEEKKKFDAIKSFL